MTRHSHASTGATTLTTVSWNHGPSVDARMSFGLVGATTKLAQVDPSFEDPVEAAARWLQRASTRAAHSEQLITLAERTVHLARDHAHELELVAGAVALDARNTGTIDPLRLEQVERMSETLAMWALRLRTLVDGAERGDDATASVRLQHALDAGEAHGSGSLELLVAQL